MMTWIALVTGGLMFVYFKVRRRRKATTMAERA
jgi:hypothetical protein